MDSLLLLGVILAAGVVIGGIIWYRVLRQRPTQRRARTKPSARTEQSVSKIATATKKNLSKARTMEEAFAIGKEGLNKIKGQIKKSGSEKPGEK